MNHFVNVTFQIPDEHLKDFMRDILNLPPSEEGFKVVKAEDMGTDEMPDRCEKTQDMPFMNEEGKA